MGHHGGTPCSATKGTVQTADFTKKNCSIV